MKVGKLDKSNVRTIAQAIQAAAEEEAHRHGVSLNYNGGSYSDGDATLKFKIVVLAPAAGVETIEEQSYNARRGMHNLPLLRAVVQIRGKKYEVLGWKPRARTYPVIAMDIMTKKKFKFHVDDVANAKVC